MSTRPTNSSGVLLVVSGPSGVGKTSIVRPIEERFGGVFSVSATTRPPAGGEVEGRDYHFLSSEQFEAMVDRGEFLEHARVFGLHFYGTPRDPVEKRLAEGRLIILDIDVQGAFQVKRAMPEAFMLFILPPGDEELLRRLLARAREPEAMIQSRFAEAKREIELARTSGVYDATVVNDDLDRAIEEACQLVRERLGLV
ncbi:MAG: guanylate kinase [Planctomycetes bacterium]|nr:guanylate kinase [Planctomycetota bacterium]